MKRTAEKYQSYMLSAILSEISPQEQAQTDQQMLLAVEIAEAMKRKGLKKNDLARMMDVEPWVISRWLSGTYPFEFEILMKLEHHLATKFINPDMS